MSHTHAYPSTPSAHTAFTLVEMLVVIAIISLLSAILVPIVAGAGETADELVCQNNLTGIGKAMKEWQVLTHSKSDVFPQRLAWLNDDRKGGSLGGNVDLFICPFDDTNGTDSEMGRPAGWNSSWEPNVPREIASMKNSYFYEVSGTPCPWATGKSWGQWKRWQKKHGRGGSSYPASKMPILRCFHHQDDWTSLQTAAGGQAADITQQDVFNVSWGLSFFKSRPYWEADIPTP